MKKLIPMAGLAASGLLMITSCVAADTYDRGPTYVRENHYYPTQSSAPAPSVPDTPPPAERDYVQADYGQAGAYAGQPASVSDQGGYGTQGSYGGQGTYDTQGTYGAPGGYNQSVAYPAAPGGGAAEAGYSEGYREGYRDSQQDTRVDEQYYDTRYYDRRANNIDINYFHGRLAPYGDWVPSRRYGYVWCPRHVSAGWRPYVVGHWAWTDDYGWMWVSDESWGWATYHYGRWYYDDDFGWAWVPGYTWAPAWVAWRHSPTYVGWAPIPPDIDIDVRVGFHFDINLVSTRIRPHHWCFMQEQYFVEPDCSRYVVSPVGNTVIINNTTVINNYKVVNQRIVNNNIDVVEVERRTRRRVPHYRVARADSVEIHGRVERDTLRVFQPSVKPEPRGVKAPPREIRERTNVAQVKGRQTERVKVLQTSLARQEQEIKAGRRRPDAPAPELVSIPERERRSRQGTSDPATRPATAGRIQPTQPTRPEVTGRTAQPGRIQPAQPARPEVTGRPAQPGRIQPAQPTRPEVTGRTAQPGQIQPVQPTRRGTLPSGRAEVTPRSATTPARPAAGATQPGAMATPTRTIPGRNTVSEPRPQSSRERDSIRTDGFTLRGGSAPEPRMPAASRRMEMPQQARPQRGNDAPTIGTVPEMGGPTTNPAGRAYGRRPGEDRTPAPRPEMMPPSITSRGVEPPARMQIRDQRSEAAPRQEIEIRRPEPERVAPRQAVERPSEPERVAPRQAVESRRSEPERVAPKEEVRSSSPAPSRGGGRSGREKDRD